MQNRYLPWTLIITFFEIISLVTAGFQKLNELSSDQQIEENILIALRKTDIKKMYVVDRATGLWKCEIWVNVSGSWYPHQYVVWAHKFISSANLLPVFSQFEKQHFTKIVIDESIEIHFFEPLDGLKIEYIGTYRGSSCSNVANCD